MHLRELLLITYILISIPIMAQNENLDEFRWNIVGTIPASTGEQKSLGFAGPLSGVDQDILMVGGGANFPEAMPWAGGKKVYYDELYAFRKNGSGNAIFTGKVLHLPFKTAYGASCSTPQGVVYAGGENSKDISNKVLLIRWNKAGESIDTQYLPDLPIAVTSASIAFHDHFVYLAGGQMTTGASNSFLALDLHAKESGWKIMPSLPESVSHAVMIVQSKDGRPCIYLAGGRKQNSNGISTLYKTLYEFNLDENEWLLRKELPYSLSAGSGIALKPGYIMLLGGNDGENFREAETVIAGIKREKDEEKKRMLMERQTLLQSSHPGFRKEVFLYNIASDVWTVAALLPFEGRVNTNALWWGDAIVIPSGEIKPGIRSPEIVTGSYSDK